MTLFARLASIALLLAGLVTPAVAQDARPVLTVYTYSSFAGEYGPGKVVKERFENQCGCTLDWVTGDDGALLLTRLKLEGNRSPADIVLGFDTSLAATAEATGLFAPHGIEATGLDLPFAWASTTFLPYDWGWFGFVYDKTKLASPPNTLANLVAAPDSLRIVIEDPRTSTPGLGLLLWVKSVYGDKAEDAWRKLKPKIVTVTKGWDEAYGLFQKGEADMVLSYTTSPAYHIAVDKTDKYAAVIFPEGHYPQIELAGMLKSSKHPELARDFLRFMLAAPFQSAIPETNWMYPATAAGGRLPASFVGLPVPTKTLLLPADQVGQNREAWIDEWLKAMGS